MRPGRGWMCMVVLAGSAACRQPNPDWLGPAGQTLAASEDDGTATLGGDATATDAEPTTGEGSGEIPIPMQCFADPVPGSGECPEACSACEDGRCIVDCTELDCSHEGVECPAGWPCDVRCTDDGACKRAEIACPPDRDCTVDCEGFEGCQRAEVRCGGGTCAVTCGAVENACRSLEVACGPADASVTCASPSSVELQPQDGSACACEDFDCEG